MLVDVRELDRAVPLAAEVRRQVSCPQPVLLNLPLQPPDNLAQPLVARVERCVDVVVVDVLKRPHPGAHELAHPVEFFLEIGVYREIDHRCPSMLLTSPASPGTPLACQ